MKSFILRHLVVGRLGARALFSPAEHRWDTASPIQQHVAELIASVIKAEGGAGYCEGVAGETGVVTQRRCDCAGTRHPFTAGVGVALRPGLTRSEEHTSELQSLMRISYAVFCLKKNNTKNPP